MSLMRLPGKYIFHAWLWCFVDALAMVPSPGTPVTSLPTQARQALRCGLGSCRSARLGPHLVIPSLM